MNNQFPQWAFIYSDGLQGWQPHNPGQWKEDYTACKANKHLAQGNALGNRDTT